MTEISSRLNVEGPDADGDYELTLSDNGCDGDPLPHCHFITTAGAMALIDALNPLLRSQLAAAEARAVQAERVLIAIGHHVNDYYDGHGKASEWMSVIADIISRLREVAASGSQGEGAAQADGRLAVYEPLVPLPDAATPAPRWQDEKNDVLTRTGEPDVLPPPQHASTNTKGE